MHSAQEGDFYVTRLYTFFSRWTILLYERLTEDDRWKEDWIDYAFPFLSNYAELMIE